MHHVGRWLIVWRKSLMEITQECGELYWTSPGGSTPQNSSYTSANITKTIQIRRIGTYRTGHCRRNKNEPISDILQWTPSNGWAMSGRLARTYIQQLCTGRGSSLEDLPGAMDDIDGWWDRVREIRAHDTTWRWNLRNKIHLLYWMTLVDWIVQSWVIHKYRRFF